MKNLTQLREQIDAVDKQIVRSSEQRMQISADVAKYKISIGKKVFDKEREQAKLASLKAMAHNDFNRHGVEELFQQIMSMSRKLQYQLLAQNGAVRPSAVHRRWMTFGTAQNVRVVLPGGGGRLQPGGHDVHYFRQGRQ